MATGRTLTNKWSLSYIKEATPGVLPGSPLWQTLEPNAITKWGADPKLTPRDPISNLRQRRKGEVTDLDSAVEFEVDATYSAMQDFMPGTFGAIWKGAPIYSSETATAPTAISATAITVPTLGITLAQNTLIRVRGAGVAANNTVFVVGAGSTATSIVITGGTVETPPVNCSVEVCGFQFVAGDLKIDASQNLTSTASAFTTANLNLQVGQYIHVGDLTNAVTAFATSVSATNVNYGLARIDAVAAGTLTLSRRGATWSADTGAAKTVRVYFGRWIRNVANDHADALEATYQFEGRFKDLGGAGVDYYQYPLGNAVDKVELTLAMANKVTSKYAFVGTTTQPPGTVRASGASTARLPTGTAMLQTTSDIARLRVINTDETGLMTDFKSLKVALTGNAGREKVLGTLGGKYLNWGNFEVDIDAEALFTNFDVQTAILANRTQAIDCSMKNADGGFVLDCPAMMISGGGLSLPKDESIKISAKMMSFADPVLGYSASLSMFPFLPAV